MFTNLVKLLLNGNASFMPDKNTGQELLSTSTCLQLWSTWTGFQLASDNGILFYFIIRKSRVNSIIFHLVSVHKNCLDPKKKKLSKNSNRVSLLPEVRVDKINHHIICRHQCLNTERLQNEAMRES